MIPLLTADTPDPAPTWVLAGWAVLVLAFVVALGWSCVRAWRDRNREDNDDA